MFRSGVPLDSPDDDTSSAIRDSVADDAASGGDALGSVTQGRTELNRLGSSSAKRNGKPNGHVPSSPEVDQCLTIRKTAGAPDDAQPQPGQNQYRTLQDMEERQRSIHQELGFASTRSTTRVKRTSTIRALLIREHDDIEAKAEPIRKRMAGARVRCRGPGEPGRAAGQGRRCVARRASSVSGSTVR
jgi:hypothetical protein